MADLSLSARRVARELDAIIAQRGRTDSIVSDNGAENAILALTDDSGVGWRLHRVWQAPPEQLQPKASTAGYATSC